jgi:ketosteroid isomerase-like protein
MRTAMPNDDVHAIDAMYAEALQSFQTGDLDAVLTHWEDDGFSLWPAVPLAIGKSAIKASLRGILRRLDGARSLQAARNRGFGKYWLSAFFNRSVLTPKSGGQPMQMKLNGVHVYRKQPKGLWRFKIVIAVSTPLRLLRLA